MAARKKGTPAATHAFAGLERAMHEKARLSILTALLSRPDGVLFNELKQLCDLTDGNLSRHVAVLQENELVEVWKNHEGPRPKTRIQLSAAGRRNFLAYIEELERVVRAARAESAAPDARRRRGPEETGWVPA